MASDDYHKHFLGQIAQKAFIEKDDRVLLVQYPPGDRAAGLWDLPGGRLHEGEEPHEGLKREVLEEIGAPISVGEILGVGVNVVRADFKLFYVIYRAELADPTQALRPEAGEIGAIEWKPKVEFLTLPAIYTGYPEILRSYLSQPFSASS